MKASDILKESDLQRQVLDHLSYLGVYCWRNNTGAYKRGRTWIRYGKVGSADITGILKDGRRLEIETKTSCGSLSEDQRHFAHAIQRNKGVYLVIRSLEELHHELRRHVNGS